MRPVVSSGLRGGYEAALEGVWNGLSRALAELEWLAADPDERLDEEAAGTLARLQYVLHNAAELAVGIEPLVPEWRGALFRVRLARLRVATPRPLPELEPEPEHNLPRHALAATVCSLAGAAAFTIGAVVAAWPLWAAGLAVFAASLLVYRPRP